MMYRIRDFGEDHNLSQRQIAEVIHTTQQHYSKIACGKADIYGETLILLAKFYNESADYILDLTNQLRPLYKTKEPVK